MTDEHEYDLRLLCEVDVLWVEMTREAMRALTRLRAADLFEIVDANFNALRDFYEELFQRVESGQAVLNRQESFELRRRCVAVVLNLVSSVFLYQEHLEVEATRLRGQDATKELHAKFSRAYDDCPELLLLFRLRRIMTHDRMTFLSYRLGSRVVGDSDAKQAHASVYLKLSSLLEVKDAARTESVKQMLAQRVDDRGRVDFLSLARTGLERLAVLHHEVASAVNPEVLKHARNLSHFYSIYVRNLHNPQGLMLSELNDDGVPSSGQHIMLYPEDFAHAQSLVDANRAEVSDHPQA